MHGTPAEFATEWIAAWNNNDLDALMAHYSEDVTFTSPRAATVTGAAVVRGKDALRARELFRFGPDGLVTAGEAMHGAAG